DDAALVADQRDQRHAPARLDLDPDRAVCHSVLLGQAQQQRCDPWRGLAGGRPGTGHVGILGKTGARITRMRRCGWPQPRRRGDRGSWLIGRALGASAWLGRLDSSRELPTKVLAACTEIALS